MLRRLTDRLDELLPDSRRAELPAVSHLTREQHPAAVSEAILGFVARSTSRR